jgi:hypothetical protein
MEGWRKGRREGRKEGGKKEGKKEGRKKIDNFRMISPSRYITKNKHELQWQEI